MGNLANPAWTSLVADLVPESMRGRYLGSRNMASGVAALVVLPVAGLLISQINAVAGSELRGYQAIFGLAFVTGLISTFFFQRIREPAPALRSDAVRPPVGATGSFKSTPVFTGLVVSAFVWNLALQIAGPFFNVFLVSGLGANTAEVGLVNGISSLTALIGYQLFGRWADRRGNLWVQLVTGFLIPALPFAWMVAAEPWHVGVINTFAGFLWAGFNLSTFNLLLDLTPEAHRPRGVAFYQSAVFGSAVIGPLIGGYLADAISFQFIFAVSGIGRLVAMGLFVALVYRRRPAAVAA
jgi:MFS family permease